MLDYLGEQSKNVNRKALEEILQRKQTLISQDSTQSILKRIQSLEKPKELQIAFKESISVHSPLYSNEQKEAIARLCRDLIPWRKGPFNLFETFIDSEWKSSLKWDRIKDFLQPLKNKRVLDIGCNNGYFLFRVLEENPKLALGIDPVIQCWLQYKLVEHFIDRNEAQFELLGVEHLEHFKNYFDTIFHMGILYHHRHPMQQLIDIREALTPGGQAIIETIGIPGDQSVSLTPEKNYAGMPNVWFVPTLSCLINWCERAKFVDVEVISKAWQGEDEQRLTEWCRKEGKSFGDALSPDDKNLTIEGYPAPLRFCISVKKKPA